MRSQRKLRMKKGLLTIGEIAKAAGVLKSTVRYYTDIGILKVAAYSKGGYRLYKKDETLNIIRKVKPVNEKRITLKRIKALLDRMG